MAEVYPEAAEDSLTEKRKIILFCVIYFLSLKSLLHTHKHSPRCRARGA